MRKSLTLSIIFLVFSGQSLFACDDWFNSLKIKGKKTCESECRTAMTDMATYMCTQQCETLCKDVDVDFNFYGLTDAEIKFCQNNKIDCLKAYKLTWTAEGLCKDIYMSSRTNDESDACRHYVWAFLMSQSLGLKNARIILDAHENNKLEPLDQKSMDLHNNKIGLSDFKKNQDATENQIVDLFKSELKNKKLKILTPRFSKTGGLP